MIPALRRLLATASRPAAVEIPATLWESALRVQSAGLPALARLDPAGQLQLRDLVARFLAEKKMSAAAGLELTAAMELHIALQACLPVLRLGLHWYRGWSGIVVYPAPFRVRRKVHEETGVVHEFDAELTGEAWDGGPVVLSWDEGAAPAPAGAQGSAPHPANVVVHEFAHKIDLLDGAADGIPPFDNRLHRGLERGAWRETMEDAYERFCAELDLVESEIPRDVDPDSPEADPYFARLPLDPYAATDPGEFFAVSSEAYFLEPERIRNAFPQWFELLRRFYAPGD